MHHVSDFDIQTDLVKVPKRTSGRFKLHGSQTFNNLFVNSPFSSSSLILILVQSYWQTQVRQFGTAAFFPPRIVCRCVNNGSAEGGNIFVNVFGPDYKNWIKVQEGKGIQKTPRGFRSGK